jgi:hypothetical protein
LGFYPVVARAERVDLVGGATSSTSIPLSSPAPSNIFKVFADASISLRQQLANIELTELKRRASNHGIESVFGPQDSSAAWIEAIIGVENSSITNWATQSKLSNGPWSLGGAFPTNATASLLTNQFRNEHVYPTNAIPLPAIAALDDLPPLTSYPKEDADALDAWVSKTKGSIACMQAAVASRTLQAHDLCAKLIVKRRAMIDAKGGSLKTLTEEKIAVLEAGTEKQIAALRSNTATKVAAMRLQMPEQMEAYRTEWNKVPTMQEKRRELDLQRNAPLTQWLKEANSNVGVATTRVRRSSLQLCWPVVSPKRYPLVATFRIWLDTSMRMCDP